MSSGRRRQPWKPPSSAWHVDCSFQVWETRTTPCLEEAMNNVIYLIGLIVVVIAILSFFGLR